MNSPVENRAGWSIAEAERLLLSLQGVVSARVIARPGGQIEEIHILTTADVRPKATVRNVESALLAHLDLSVDHRKISVAQTTTEDPVALPEPEASVHIMPGPSLRESRILFVGHRVETEKANQVRHRVEIEWQGEPYVGQASAADLPRPKLEAVALATLRAIELALQDKLEGTERTTVSMSLEGVKVVEAFDRKFVLVAVHAMAGRHVARLAGTTVSDDATTDRAAILATLQATDRWVRGNAKP